MAAVRWVIAALAASVWILGGCTDQRCDSEARWLDLEVLGAQHVVGQITRFQIELAIDGEVRNRAFDVTEGAVRDGPLLRVLLDDSVPDTYNGQVEVTALGTSVARTTTLAVGRATFGAAAAACISVVVPLASWSVDGGVLDSGSPDSGLEAGISPDSGQDAGVSPDSGQDAGQGCQPGSDGGSGCTPNLVSNPGFELGTDGWNLSGSGNPRAVAGGANGSGTALAITANGTQSTAQQPISAIRGGADYRFSVFCRTTSLVTVGTSWPQASLRFRQVSGAFTGTPTYLYATASTWMEQVTTVRAPDDAVSAQVQLYTWSNITSGEVRFDDVALREHP